MRRLITAIAALMLAMSFGLVFAQPAQAAPGGSCSGEEWRSPGNWASCTKRLGTSVTDKTGCVTAPAPNSPTAGAAGWFTEEPDSALRDGIAGMYSRYGVGGYGLDTYDIGCLGTVKHPDLVGSTWLANGEFQLASSVVGAANGLRERAYNPDIMWSWSDGFLADVTHATYKYVFNPIGIITIGLVGMFLLYRARRGQMNQAVQVTAWAIMVLTLVTAVAKWPVEAAHGADAAGAKGLAVVHGVLGPAKHDTPDAQCDLGPGAPGCKDNRDAATRASDVATETILYKPWLRAVLGDDNSATAKKYGPALYDATSMTWGEAARAEQNPGLRQQLIEQKAQTWNAIAEKIRTEDPVAYEYLQGNHSGDRVWGGAIADGSALTFAAFDMLASIVIIFSFGVFRIAILFLPLLGTVGIFYYTSSGIRRIANAVSSAFFNIVLFGAYAGAYLMTVDKVFSNDGIAGPWKIVIIGLIGAGSLLIMHPFRHLYSTATGRPRSADSVIARGMAQAKQIRENNTADKAATDQAISEAAGTGQAPVRPENRRASSTMRGVGKAAAPSVTSIPEQGTYTVARDAAVDPANKRPEIKNRVDRYTGRLGSIVNAVGDANRKPTPEPVAATPAPAARPEK
jgi:hypothetical protein